MEIDGISLQWPPIVAAVVVSAASWVVTAIVRKASTKVSEMLDNVATRDFVTDTMKEHRAKVLAEISEMFVKSSFQQVSNNDIELRMRRIELSTGVTVPNPMNLIL